MTPYQARLVITRLDAAKADPDAGATADGRFEAR